MTLVDRGRAAGMVLMLLPLGCGSSGGSDGGQDAAPGVCVEDSHNPAGCQTSWTLSDPCALLPATSAVEAVVFNDACPSDAVLASGDTSAAIQRQFVAPGKPFAAVSGLDLVSYGFAFLLRDDMCAVIAWGCTPANLVEITQIQTSVQNWTATDMCAPAYDGSCYPPTTCSSGTCR